MRMMLTTAMMRMLLLLLLLLLMMIMRMRKRRRRMMMVVAMIMMSNGVKYGMNRGAGCSKDSTALAAMLPPCTTHQSAACSKLK